MWTKKRAPSGASTRRSMVLEDIARLRADGVTNINIDLIAGLPHQTAESWKESLAETVTAGAPHVSVYMLEVDDESRLGRELIAGGTRYHAHFVPDEDAVADFYVMACEFARCFRNSAIRDFQFRASRIRVEAQPEILDAPALSRLWRRRALDAAVSGRCRRCSPVQHSGLLWRNLALVQRCRRPVSLGRKPWKNLSSWDCA